MATHYVVHTPAASSSLARFSNHERNRPLLSEQRAVFVFVRPFISGVFLGVRALAFDV